jgi:Zn finger protein HypA/HybF involved in hydrogenase expression
MHEMGIACSVLDAVQKELERYPGMRASKVGLRIGEYAGVDPESLRFCFEAAAMSYQLAPIDLDVTWCRATEGRRGDELDFAFVEMEDLEEVRA